MEENNNMIEQEEQSIDFGKLFQDLLKHKRLYFIVLPVAFVLAAIYSMSLPNYYNCTVTLAPELGGKGGGGGALSGLASSFGINLGGVSSGSDAGRTERTESDSRKSRSRRESGIKRSPVHLRKYAVLLFGGMESL